MKSSVIFMKAVFDVSFLSCISGFFERFKSAQNDHLFIDVDIRNINSVSLALTDASDSASVIASNVEVSHVAATINCPEIAPTVICSDSIDMIDLNRSFTSNHSPNQSMSKISLTKKIYSNVTATADIASRFISVALIPCSVLSRAASISISKHFSGAFFKGKNPSIRIVIKKFTQVVCGWYFMNSHISLRNRLCWSVGGDVGASSSASILALNGAKLNG